MARKGLPTPLVIRLREHITDGYIFVDYYHKYGTYSFDVIEFAKAEDMESIGEAGGSNIDTVWFARIERTFEGNNLNFVMFKAKTLVRDEESPIPWMLRALKELESLIIDPKNLNMYLLTDLSGDVIYEDGVLKFGSVEHILQESSYKKLIDTLWRNRRVVDANGKLLKKEKAVTRNLLENNLNINYERLKDIRSGIRKINSTKYIPIKLLSPDNKRVFLEVISSK